ncbi:hypothetical protein H920_04922 [Fukomys damarensis]|uniref:Uncharacterized protein n=1 Tax=Fukomys damarensis TaxID=885580 RepID=A0A091DRG6_FUKDA|nr:hypothetical protein H920_04922 [Fukomys damarensis]
MDNTDPHLAADESEVQGDFVTLEAPGLLLTQPLTEQVSGHTSMCPCCCCLQCLHREMSGDPGGSCRADEGTGLSGSDVLAVII